MNRAQPLSDPEAKRCGMEAEATRQVSKNMHKWNHLIDQSLQVWATTTLPNGKGVVYAGINIINNKVYVGQYGFGNTKRTASVKAARWTPHENGRSKCTLINNAVKKWGKQNFRWFVVELVDVCDLNTSECHWVDAFNSMRPNGYNLKTAGDSVRHDEQTIEKMKKTRNSPEYVAELKKRRKAQWDADKDRFVEAMNAGKRTDTGRANMSNAQKRVWQNRSTETIEAWKNKHKECKEKKRKQQLDSANTDEERDELFKKFKRNDRQSKYNNDVRDGVRKVVISPKERFEGKSKRQKAWWNARTAEEIAKSSEKRRQTIEKRRQLQLEQCLNPNDRKKLIAKFKEQDYQRAWQARKLKRTSSKSIDS